MMQSKDHSIIVSLPLGPDSAPKLRNDSKSLIVTQEASGKNKRIKKISESIVAPELE